MGGQASACNQANQVLEVGGKDVLDFPYDVLWGAFADSKFVPFI